MARLMNIDILVYVLWNLSRKNQTKFSVDLLPNVTATSRQKRINYHVMRAQQAKGYEKATTQWSEDIDLTVLKRCFADYRKLYESDDDVVRKLLFYAKECGVETNRLSAKYEKMYKGTESAAMEFFYNVIIHEATVNTRKKKRQGTSEHVVATSNSQIPAIVSHLSCRAKPNIRTYESDSERDASFEKLRGQLLQGGPIFVTGIGGIGKSEFVLHSMAKLEREGYRTYQTEFKGTLLDTILQLQFESIENAKGSKDYPNEGELDAAYKLRMNLLRAHDEKTILLIDNFDAPDMKTYDLLLQNGAESPVYADIRSLRMHVVFTTRNTDFYDEDPICIGPLSKQLLRKIVLQYYEGNCTPEVLRTVDLILEQIESHTLTADLIGRTLRVNPQLTVDQVLYVLQAKKLGNHDWDNIRSSYRTDRHERAVLEHLMIVFSMAGLTEMHKRLLCCLSILPLNGAPIDCVRQHLARMLEADLSGSTSCHDFRENIAPKPPEVLGAWNGVKENLIELCKGGWIQQRGTTIDMHRLIRMVCWNCEETSIQWERVKSFANSLAYTSEQLIQQPITKVNYPVIEANICMMLSLCRRIQTETDDIVNWDDTLSNMTRVCAELCEKDGSYSEAMLLWMKFAMYCILQEGRIQPQSPDLLGSQTHITDGQEELPNFTINGKSRLYLGDISTLKRRKKFMSVISSDGSTETVEVLVSFIVNATGKEYVVYASPKAIADENGDIDVSISRVLRKPEGVVLNADFSDSEYHQVLKIIDDLGEPKGANNRKEPEKKSIVDEQDIRLQLARAYSHMAQISEYLGDSKDTLVNLNTSIMYYERLDKESLELAYVYQRRALYFDRFNEDEKAEENYQTARRIFKLHGISTRAPGTIRKKVEKLSNGKNGWRYVVNGNQPQTEWQRLMDNGKLLIEDGYVADGIGCYIEALEYLRQIYGTDTIHSFSIYKALADAYVEDEQYEMAEEAYDKALLLRNSYHLYEDMNTKVQLAVCLWCEGKTGDATQCAMEALAEVEDAHTRDFKFLQSGAIFENYLFVFPVIYAENHSVMPAYTRGWQCAFLEEDMTIEDQCVIQEAFVQLRESVLGKGHTSIKDDYEKLYKLFARALKKYGQLIKMCDETSEDGIRDEYTLLSIWLDYSKRANQYGHLCCEALQVFLKEQDDE